MDLSNKKIIVGGWPAFAEANGVNKKEPVETFDWIPFESDKFYYNDMRAALDLVEGSREWLKAYTFDKAKEKHAFSSEIANNLIQAMWDGHSGSSGASMMWNYKRALNDWDHFVFKTKEYEGLRSFKCQQIPMWKVKSLQDKCNIWLSTEEESMKDFLGNILLEECAKLCLAGMDVPEIMATLMFIERDLLEIQANDEKKKAEERHCDLMESLEFLYEHPIRWFDTPSGCTLMPRHPTQITRRAIAEMEAKFPGYDKHIENVLFAMGSPRKPSYGDGAGGIFSKEGRAIWDDFLRRQKVIA
jgi:hypothetical protein